MGGIIKNLTIQLDCNYIRIPKTELNESVWKQLREQYSITPAWQYIRAKKSAFGRITPTYFITSTKDWYLIPTGFLNEIKEFLPELPMEQIADYRQQYKNTTLRPLQEDALELWPYQAKAVQELLTHERAILVSPTGSGKTFVLSELLRYSKKTLILISQIAALKQMEGALNERIQCKTTLLGGGKVPSKDHDVCISTVMSAHKLDLDSYDMVLFDECHRLPSSAYRKVAMACKNAWYRFGCTGTIKGRSDELEKWIDAAISSKHVVVAKEDVQPFLSAAQVFILPCRNNIVKPLETFQEIYREGIVQNNLRNQMITTLCDYHKNKNIFVFVNWTEQGKILHELIPNSILLTHKSSLKEREEVMQSWEGKTVIATNIFSESINVPAINVIINAAGGKAKIGLTQVVGRGLRKVVGKILSVYDFDDCGHPLLQMHAKRRQRIYRGITKNIYYMKDTNGDK